MKTPTPKENLDKLSNIVRDMRALTGIYTAREDVTDLRERIVELCERMGRIIHNMSYDIK